MIAPRSILTSGVAEALRCPVCRSLLRGGGERLECTRDGCGASFRVVDGVPVLINESSSVFPIADIVAGRSFHGEQPRGFKEKVLNALPHLSRNLKAPENFALLHRLLRERGAGRVLIIGGGGLGEGLAQIVDDPAFDVVESDVYFGRRTNLVCDAHDLPFADGTFDAVIIQAVIHALLDPVRGVGEIHRVLAAEGLAYCEAPFMQQICEGSFDFHRFSHLGLRRLFRHFEEIGSGAQGGPGMAAAWAYQHLLWSFVSSKRARVLTRVFARLTGFWLLFFDRLVIDRPAAIDAASGVFFLGRRSDSVLSDKELIGQYRGWQR